MEASATSTRFTCLWEFMMVVDKEVKKEGRGKQQGKEESERLKAKIGLWARPITP